MIADAKARHFATFRVPVHHPALAGHFPGNPIVPAVVVLDAVISAAEDCLGTQVHVHGMPQAKFLAPLLPDETARIELAVDGPLLVFGVYRGDATIAKGTLSITAGAAS